MNSEQTSPNEEAVHKKIRLIQNQLVSLHRWVEESGADKELLDHMTAPYEDLLEEIYSEELQLARALDSSDLLLHYEGPSAEEENPRISLLAKIFGDVRKQVLNVAKAVAGLADEKRMQTELDLGLASYARGSLYVGFTVPPSDASLLGEEDPLQQHLRNALRALGVVNKKVTEGAAREEIDEEIGDPAVRDATFQALKELAPSGRKGLSSLHISGRDFPEAADSLTPETRGRLREWIKKPKGEATTLEEAVYVGVIREMDLDDRRFALRKIEGRKVQAIRCTYDEMYDKVASDWLGHRVEVLGGVEKTRSGSPSLLHVEDVNLIS